MYFFLNLEIHTYQCTRWASKLCYSIYSAAFLTYNTCSFWLTCQSAKYDIMHHFYARYLQNPSHFCVNHSSQRDVENCPGQENLALLFLSPHLHGLVNKRGRAISLWCHCQLWVCAVCNQIILLDRNEMVPPFIQR